VYVMRPCWTGPESDPAAQERIAQSRDEIARGEGLSIAEVARSLEERFGKRRP